MGLPIEIEDLSRLIHYKTNLQLSIFQNSNMRFILNSVNSKHYIGFFKNIPQQFDILHR